MQSNFKLMAKFEEKKESNNDSKFIEKVAMENGNITITTRTIKYHIELSPQTCNHYDWYRATFVSTLSGLSTFSAGKKVLDFHIIEINIIIAFDGT